MMMLVQVVAAGLLLLGSGLIFLALIRLDRPVELARPPLGRPATQRVPQVRKLPRAA
jgi:hypothetical protein